MVHKVLKVDGVKAVHSTNIIERMWWKLAVYSGAGVFCVSRGIKDLVWATPETKELYRQAIAETVTLAKTKGILLPAPVPDEHIAILDNFTSEWKPSMLVVLEQGHPLELEYLHGTICAMGRESGLHTPINDYIYACLKPYVDGMH